VLTSIRAALECMQDAGVLSLLLVLRHQPPLHCAEQPHRQCCCCCSNAGKIYVRNDLLFFTMVPVIVLFFATSCIMR
jgi:hypothetical protein